MWFSGSFFVVALAALSIAYVAFGTVGLMTTVLILLMARNSL
jgi:hypothetical protein